MKKETQWFITPFPDANARIAEFIIKAGEDTDEHSELKTKDGKKHFAYRVSFRIINFIEKSRDLLNGHDYRIYDRNGEHGLARESKFLKKRKKVKNVK